MSFASQRSMFKAIPILVVCFLSAISFSTVSYAQETVSGLRGVVTDASGTPLADVTITVRNEDSGLTRTVTTGASGEYAVRNLPIGDNYTVSAQHAGSTSKKTEEVILNLGKTAVVNVALTAGAASAVEEIVVYGTVTAALQVAKGPSAVFDLGALEDAPAINRNITDVLRQDPRVYVDEARGAINSVQCAGKNPRFNSLTVDGVRLNDSFGLNSNGYPTERIPFSYDAIKQLAVELAPFDVEYGGFTACNINSVIKSGGNEFHGSVFYDYTDDGLRGDSLEGDRINTGDSDEKRYGINLGGPIIKDKLFFFAAYEKLEGTDLFDRGPLGSGAVNEIDVTQAELDEIAQISRDLYQYDPGVLPRSRPNDDEKFLVKIDWNINEQHRAAFNYTYNDGFTTRESDSDSNEFEFSNHLYERGSELNSYSAILYSDWNDKFSTEFRVGRLELDGRQNPVGGRDFGEIRVELDNVDVYLGADDSRQSNDLDYDVNTFAFKGNYQMDNGHTLTFGLEREDLEVFNLFVQHTETELRFRGGIDAFRAGRPSAIYYNNAPSQNPDDAAARWGYALNSAYIQDEFAINGRLDVLFGLRYDLYTTSDAPLENADFVADYGFSNSTNLDGEGLLQPRIAFTFDWTDSTTVRGGIGVYSGGNPNVWLSNNFSANNVLQFGQRGRGFGYTDGSRSLFDTDVVYSGLEAGAPSGPGYGVPSELFDAVAAGTGDNFEINYLDPNFNIPSELKIALGITHVTAGEYVLNADLLLTDGKDTAIVLRGDLEQTGVTAEGYPQYDSVREPAFVLTNSRIGNESVGLSFSVSKKHDNGLDWTVGYAYNDAEDITPMTSQVAFSNYTNRSFFDPQEQVLSTSNFNIEHRLTAVVNYRKAFFGDNMTTFSLVGSSNSGRPYSRAFNGTADPYGFTPFLDNADNVLQPGTRRNGEESSSWTKIDFRVEQEFPGFRDGDKASAFMVIDNLTNLINDDWGVLYEVSFPRGVDVDDTTPESRVGDASRFEIRFGVKYEF